MLTPCTAYERYIRKNRNKTLLRDFVISERLFLNKGNN